ncbi:MAG TPA: hypothetical protein VI792_09255 [Candidatus Eisenbacteria bacterium]
MSRRERAPAPAPSVPPPLPLAHPASLAAAAVAALCVIVSVSFRLEDTDLWQLLVTGKATWVLHRVPTTNLWTWVHPGIPQVASSWLFRALLWPVWDHFGLAGLVAWRWATTLAAFGLAWAAARALGARGALAPVVLVWGALVYRLRSEVRPETLAAVLFAAQLWILVARRAGGRDRGPWIVLIAWIWANAHASYHAGLLLTTVFLAAEWLAARRGAARPRRPLWSVLAASIAISFVNPSGWRMLAQPFQYLLVWRAEPMYRAIEELQPVRLSAHWRSGLPLLLAGWPLLALLRARQRAIDAAEWLLVLALTPLALSSQRFLGLYALAAAPFVARDLEAATAALPRPPWSVTPWARGGLAAVAAIAICIPEWTRVEIPLGMGFRRAAFPVAACDFMAAHGVGGRAFNHFHLGGYMAYRSWPATDRLPFMTTQPENAPREDRAMYVAALTDRNAWLALDLRYGFDYLLLARQESPGELLEQNLEGDSTWAMVFADDAAEVLVRRAGPLRAVADSFAYRVLPPSEDGRRFLVGACASDTILRRHAIVELERQAAASPENGSAHRLLGMFAMMDGRMGDARAHLERTLALDPLVPGVHPLLAVIASSRGDRAEAERQLAIERRLHGEIPGLAPPGPR